MVGYSKSTTESPTGKARLSTMQVVSMVLSHVLAFLAGAWTAVHLLLALPMVG
jgi:hypothetical protein